MFQFATREVLWIRWKLTDWNILNNESHWCRIFCHLASMLLILQNILAGFLKTVPANGPFVSNSFFRPKTISKVTTIKAKSATIALFLFDLLLSSFSLFLFVLSSFFVSVILELIGPRKAVFWHLFTQTTLNFARLISKKSARYY